MAIKFQHKIATDSNTQFIFVVLGLPIAGLVYCGLGIAGMASLSVIREHPLISGILFFCIPFIAAVSIWIKASAQAYKN